MLAATYGSDKKKHITHLVFPALVSPKVDGIRMLVVDGVCQSRSGKPIPCPTVQALFGGDALEGLDGELTIGPLTASNLMQRTMAVMSDSELEGDDLATLQFNVFDKWDCPEEQYIVRAERAQRQIDEHFGVQLPRLSVPVYWLPHCLVSSMDELLEHEETVLGLGYEGLMYNLTTGLYKNGRCGKKAPDLVKVKRFIDDDAIIVGFTEMMHNDNVAFKSELGKTKRATLKENMRPAGKLGSLRLRVTTGRFVGKEFDCSGFTEEQRNVLWLQRDTLLGKLTTFKHFAQTGAVDLPRQPVWKGFRHPDDT